VNQFNSLISFKLGPDYKRTFPVSFECYSSELYPNRLDFIPVFSDCSLITLIRLELLACIPRESVRFEFLTVMVAPDGRVGHPFMNGNERMVQKNERN